MRHKIREYSNYLSEGAGFGQSLDAVGEIIFGSAFPRSFGKIEATCWQERQVLFLIPFARYEAVLVGSSSGKVKMGFEVSDIIGNRFFNGQSLVTG